MKNLLPPISHWHKIAYIVSDMVVIFPSESFETHFLSAQSQSFLRSGQIYSVQNSFLKSYPINWIPSQAHSLSVSLGKSCRGNSTKLKGPILICALLKTRCLTIAKSFHCPQFLHLQNWDKIGKSDINHKKCSKTAPTCFSRLINVAFCGLLQAVLYSPPTIQFISHLNKQRGWTSL